MKKYTSPGRFKTVPGPIVDCKYFGEPTGNTVPCESCGEGNDGKARSMQKTFGCSLFGKCTIDRKGEGAACCNGCTSKVSKTTLGVSRSILLTGGIGDVIAVEAMFSPEFRERLETIYYACPAIAEITQLFPALPNYPRLKIHKSIPTSGKTYLSQEAVEIDYDFLPDEVEDWSITKSFAKRFPYHGSSFLQHRLADIPKESPYVVIVPATTWGRMEGRDFTEADWQATLATLEVWNFRGVVLTRDKAQIPSHPLLSQRQLPILEAVEFVKAASGYIGIDSWVSILAAKLFAADRLLVKSINSQFYSWKTAYHAPRTIFKYLSRSIPMPTGAKTSENVVHPHHPDERAELFQSHDGGSIEVEFGEVVAALVRAFKPAHVLETGTYLGIAARIIGEACNRNGFGKVTTLELDRARAAKAKLALTDMPNVEVVQANSLQWLISYTGPPFGLVVLDSDLPVRIEELNIIRERGLAEGPVFIHDTSRLRASRTPDYPEFPAKLDAFGLPSVECHLSRGWRLLDLRRAT